MGDGTRDVVKLVSNRVITLIADEFRKEETQRTVRNNIVDPLIKMLHVQLMPYMVLTVVVVAAILIMSMMTLVLSSLFYFKRVKPLL